MFNYNKALQSKQKRAFFYCCPNECVCMQRINLWIVRKIFGDHFSNRQWKNAACASFVAINARETADIPLHTYIQARYEIPLQSSADALNEVERLVHYDSWMWSMSIGGALWCCVVWCMSISGAWCCFVMWCMSIVGACWCRVMFITFGAS